MLDGLLDRLSPTNGHASVTACRDRVPVGSTRQCGFFLSMLACLVICLFVFGGCRDSGPKTIKVRGTITMAGRPLEGGTISFQPKQGAGGGSRRPAIGQIEPDGTYELNTYKKGDGIPPGQYEVSITSLIGAPPLTVWEENPPPRKSRIPLKYNLGSTSGLEATIPEDARGTLTLDFKVD